MSPATRHQRCTVHKIVNVLGELPKTVQLADKSDLRWVWTALNRTTVEGLTGRWLANPGFAPYGPAVASSTRQRQFAQVVQSAGLWESTPRSLLSAFVAAFP